MEILDKKSNRMSRVNVDMSEHSELVELQRILDFLFVKKSTSVTNYFYFFYMHSPILF